MIECRRGLCFLDKPLQFVWIPAEVLIQKFDRHFAIEFRVLREVDLTHSPGADFGDDAVMGEGGVGG